MGIDISKYTLKHDESSNVLTIIMDDGRSIFVHCPVTDVSIITEIFNQGLEEGYAQAQKDMRNMLGL